MKCDDCDRANVVKAYCYYKNRPQQFMKVYHKAFTTEAFAEYAVEMELIWKYGVSCKKMPRSQAREYWNLLEPFLLSAYKHKQ